MPDASLFDEIAWDERGLVVAVAQDALTGRVQMVAYMNREALEKTLETRRATFHSRSRNVLWTKGETSGHYLAVSSVHLDCDGDAILLCVRPEGPSCHTGKDTCFFREARDGAWRQAAVPSATLEELEVEVLARKERGDPEKSWTRALLLRGAAAIGDKLREEADELARALDGETDDRVASEAADVLYHLMVGLAHRSVSLRRVLLELVRRRGRSGIEEKQSRNGQGDG